MINSGFAKRERGNFDTLPFATDRSATWPDGSAASTIQAKDVVPFGDYGHC